MFLDLSFLSDSVCTLSSLAASQPRSLKLRTLTIFEVTTPRASVVRLIRSIGIQDDEEAEGETEADEDIEQEVDEPADEDGGYDGHVLSTGGSFVSTSTGANNQYQYASTWTGATQIRIVRQHLTAASCPFNHRREWSPYFLS
jgi:hypothetical protein